MKRLISGVLAAVMSFSAASCFAWTACKSEEEHDAEAMRAQYYKMLAETSDFLHSSEERGGAALNTTAIETNSRRKG